MEVLPALLHVLWQITRMTCFIAMGLMLAGIIEGLNWSYRLSIISRPIIRLGHLSPVTGASFSLAFFSGVSANTMLSEAFDKEQISKRELVLANLFNSLPRFFLHLPTVFFLTVPFIRTAALLYVGLTFSVAILQTAAVVLCGRLLLPENSAAFAPPARGKRQQSWKEVLMGSLKRLKKKIPSVLKYMAPVYLLFFFASRYELFDKLNHFLAEHLALLSWLKPQALGIVMLHITTEFSAGLAAASALLADNSLTCKEVVLALLVGNVLAAPIRAIRHQFPYYTGIFTPTLALELVGFSQLMRAGCIVLVTVLYYYAG